MSPLSTWSPLDQLEDPRLESRRSEVRSGGWKNNRRENPIAFSIAFSLVTNWDLRLTQASSVHAEYPTRSISSASCMRLLGWQFYSSFYIVNRNRSNLYIKSYDISQDFAFIMVDSEIFIGWLVELVASPNIPLFLYNIINLIII